LRQRRLNRDEKRGFKVPRVQGLNPSNPQPDNPSNPRSEDAKIAKKDTKYLFYQIERW
jgi:hypothetical protein